MYKVDNNGMQENAVKEAGKNAFHLGYGAPLCLAHSLPHIPQNTLSVPLRFLATLLCVSHTGLSLYAHARYGTL